MKITKNRLKQIIKEELESVLEKQLSSSEQEKHASSNEEMADARAIINKYTGGNGPAELSSAQEKEYKSACSKIKNSKIQNKKTRKYIERCKTRTNQ
tara:strand:+ start:4784 stop:5074 length:291 start_codon:yes stop_codon:yes gene_type:complete